MIVRRIAICVALLTSSILAGLPRGANAAVITVTTPSDTIAADGQCSLREAIIASNTDQPVGGCAGGSGPDVIVFSAALARPVTLILTGGGADEDAAATGDLDVAGRLALEGDGAASLILDGNKADRVLDVRPGAAVSISGLGIRGGAAGPGAGGGIRIGATGALTLTDVIVAANAGGGAVVLGALTMAGGAITANAGGGLLVDGGGAALTGVSVAENTDGYGILNRNAASLSYDTGEVRGNASGGVMNQGSRATLSRLLIRDNGGSGVSNAGEIYTSLALRLCTLTGNHATYGAGLSNTGAGARVTVSASAFLGNQAEAGGGGIYNNGVLAVDASLLAQNRARTGGALDNAGGNLELVNVTLSSNTATDDGGGLYNRSSAVLKHVTFFGNTAVGLGAGAAIFNDTASISLQSTIVEGGGDNCTNSEGFMHSLGHNLETSDSCELTGPGDRANTSGLLEPLQANGGPTLTHAVAAGSPAIDAADPASCPATDQRGVTRPQGTGCDIGAFELSAPSSSRTYLPLALH